MWRSNRAIRLVIVLVAMWLAGPLPFVEFQSKSFGQKVAVPSELNDAANPGNEDVVKADPASALAKQNELISGIRQLTFEGKRAGESYFSRDGRWMVFQSEREADNPFFQIYLMDRQSGDTHRLSPGIGKTTCAWIHPSNQKVLFASTQFDPDAIRKQRDEIAFRASGQQRRYSWDYDPTFEIVEFDISSKEYRRLTNVEGYDAEGSYSADGKWIAFASNRRSYTGELSDEESQLFKVDPASAMDIYVMRADGSGLRRLTDVIGYDGGPFFSPDGNSICWRRFNQHGTTAEIMLMNVDGSNQRAITKLGAMSWAPFYHPSGDYLVFATNRHGFENFELYMVDAAGTSVPVRVTYRAGFDGLPVFTPDGQSLVWTSNGGSSQSQIYEAKWNDVAARKSLNLNEKNSAIVEPKSIAIESLRATEAGFSAADVLRHVDYLCRPELGGRLTGTAGERLATDYVAAYLESLGLRPSGKEGTFFHEFQFTSNVKLGPINTLNCGTDSFQVDRDWRPVFFSQDSTIEDEEIIFAGYGMVVPKEGAQAEYDSYVHLDVAGKWVMMFRGMPQDITPERRQHLARFSDMRYKSMLARERGAKGIIFVSGPTSGIRRQLVPLNMDGTLGTSSLAVISVTDDLAAKLLKLANEDLSTLQKELDNGEMAMGFKLEGVKLSAKIDIEPVSSRGRNVLALLPAGQKPTNEMIVVGAHIDHLGTGQGSGSLAKEDERGGTHRGADDNASGVAAMLEIAQYLATEVRAGRLELKRDVLFAAWSGEELGLRGSAAFTDEFDQLFPGRSAAGHATSIHKESGKQAQSEAHNGVHQGGGHGVGSGTPTLYPSIAACLNLDMVGRLRDQLVLQGIGSSPFWSGAIERRNAVVGLPLTLQNDCNLPTDASSFFLRGVPILSAFTGSHEEYHTPRDTPELLNYDGASRVARLMALVAREIAQNEQIPQFVQQPVEQTQRANLTAFLGTVPDYAKEVKGVALGGVAKDGPAEKAGLKGGDIIVELAGKKIENIYDYTFAIEALKIGQPVKVAILRAGKTIELMVTPTSRQ